MGTLTLSLEEVVKGLPLNLFQACLRLSEEPEMQSASSEKDGNPSSPENPEKKPNMMLQKMGGKLIIFSQSKIVDIL